MHKAVEYGIVKDITKFESKAVHHFLRYHSLASFGKMTLIMQEVDLCNNSSYSIAQMGKNDMTPLEVSIYLFSMRTECTP